MKSVCSFAFFLAFAGCATLPGVPKVPDGQAIDAEARRLMAREGVQGMALTGSAVDE